MWHRSLPGLRATARLVGMSLLVGVVLVMTLLLGQLTTRPAPTGPVTPPLQLGTPSGGSAKPQ
jgi:ABC-type arginine/histidine transport system permease subunit